jgi:tRNA threonylcarbamoyladenosine biosynthesis protein TsaB
MNMLALETSTTRCIAALVRDDGKRFVRDEAVGNTHSQWLLPQVEQLMRQAQLSFHALGAIAYGAGPGSFTGVRIACACAQGLGLAHGVPLVPVGTLEALSYTYRATAASHDAVWVVNDARMNELYAARYARLGATWIEATAPHVQTLAFMDTIDWSVHALAGDAPVAIAALARFRPQLSVAYPSADGLLDAALAAYAQGRVQHARDAEPAYVRNKVALTEAERARA